MPLMIEKAAVQLRSACVCILEVGGAYAYRFKSLLEFLGLTTLVVTDLDSVTAPAAVAASASPSPADAAPATSSDESSSAAAVAATNEPEETDEEEEPATSGKACTVLTPDAVTSNRTLIEWLPGQRTIAALIAATEGERTQQPSATSLATIRVAFQNPVEVTWNGETYPLIGRTLEEAFALQNLAWSQLTTSTDLGLRVRRNDTKSLADLFLRIHKRIKRKDFKKTDFALALLGQDPALWQVPRYIDEGLKWLEAQVVPAAPPLPPTLEPGLEEVQS